MKSTEKTFGTGRVGHSRSDNIDKFTVDTFDPESAGDGQQDLSPQGKSRNRNSRNRRNQKPKEFQHPTLENIIITKANVQDRLMKIAQQDAADPKVAAADDAQNDGNQAAQQGD